MPQFLLVRLKKGQYPVVSTLFGNKSNISFSEAKTSGQQWQQEPVVQPCARLISPLQKDREKTRRPKRSAVR
jgi:hypothetical protein